MLSWILMLSLRAHAADDPDAAAALLSRFPAGQVPDSTPVMNAIWELQRSGEAEHLSVLQSIRRYEASPVREAATGALAVVTLRARLEQRASYQPPERGEIRDWMADQSDLRRQDGTPLQRHEAEAVAYAVLILGEPRPVMEQTPAELILAGEMLEDQANLSGALTRYAVAAALGDREALLLLEALGLDTERLLLGMTAETGLTVTPPVTTADTLVSAGGPQTVSVLIERSRSPSELTQVQAIDALAEMLHRGQLPPSARRAARQRIEEATRDEREPMRIFAETTLNSLNLTERMD